MSEKKYIAYYRLSKDPKRDFSLGLESQNQIVHQFVDFNQGEILQEYSEIGSGSRKTRPELLKAIQHCKKEKAILLVAKLDRLGRNVAFISSILESGIDFKAVDLPDANRFMLHMLAAFAEYERQVTVDRTIKALKRARERGIKLGTYGETQAAHEKAKADKFAETIRPHIEEFRAQGIRSGAKIMAALNAKGIKTTMGKKWQLHNTYRLLQRLNLIDQDNCAIWQSVRYRKKELALANIKEG